MADPSSRRLTVEVCNARNLMPKDGQGTASAYVVVDFDGQRRRTKTKSRDLNPTWDEQLEFSVHDLDSMPGETLELNVYNDKTMGRKGKFLGKVKITGSAFAKAGSEALVYYPLEKRSVFSQIKGEIGLKIWYVDEPVTDTSTGTGTGTDEKKGESGEEKKLVEEKKEEKEGKKEVEAKKEEKEKKEEKKEEKGKKEEEKKTPEKEKPKNAEKKEEEKPKEITTPAPPTPVKELQQYSGDLEIKPHTAGDHNVKVGSYDLVERIPYLFVRLLKAKLSGDKPVYSKLVVGSQTVCTRTIPSGEWDQVFAFHKASLTATSLEVSVHEEKKGEGDKPAEHVSLGTVVFDLQEIPKRSPPDSPLAPQWYTLEGTSEGSEGCDVMLAVWIGTQVDESFQEAWQSDSGGFNTHTRCKAYLSPKLWYLRLSVIQTQDLRLPPLPESKSRPAAGTELFVKGQLGTQAFKTGRVILGGASASNSGNPCWNEDLLFVAAEPFDPYLTIVVEDITAGQPVGQAKVPLSSVHRRVDDRVEPPPRWLNLIGDEARPYAGRVHVRVCLEGGYHVLDEAVQVASDVRAASKQLSKPPIGLLEVGVRGASSLVPMKVSKDGSSGSTDAYVVLKYGPKWARTRTIIDQFNPRWNEQYAWDVFDPCTVLTIAVFDNVRHKQTEPGRDVRIGKVRIRLSTLDTNRVYINTYPLTAVHPIGARKMGEIELAIRFSCPSWLTLLQSYTNPLLPRMHYVKPLGPAQQDMLRHTAMRIVSARLARSEPPLGPEVVHYLLETDAYTWSMRRSKANWFRVVRCLSGVAGLVKWVHGVRMWTHPPTTALVHILLLIIVFCPQMILSTLFLYLFFVLVWRYRYRVREPNGMDPRLSHVDSVGPDELDEEFDGFPSSRPADVVRVRYDRIRAVAGRAQTLLGDVAAQGERFEAILNWRDPRATGLFTLFCFLISLICYMVPFKILVVLMGFYYLRHPRFRCDMPSLPFNFFRRLPSLSDRML